MLILSSKNLRAPARIWWWFIDQAFVWFPQDIGGYWVISVHENTHQPVINLYRVECGDLLTQLYLARK